MRLFQEFHLYTSERAQQHHANSSASTSTESLPTSVLTKPLVIPYLSKCCNLLNMRLPSPERLPIKKNVVVDLFWFKNLVAQAKNHSQKPNGGLTHPEPPQLETANRARPTTYVQLLQLRWKFHCYLDSHGNIDVVLYQNNFRVAEALTLTFVIQGEE